MFTALKAAQMACYFASQQGDKINILKLMKLLYLADRESMARHGEPISFDRFVSMDHGPVLTRTLNLIDGTYPKQFSADWDEWVSDRENHFVACNRQFAREELDLLSDADLDVLDSVWARFGGMDQWELRDYTHKNCPEWQDPGGSSIPIDEATILRAVGFEDDEAQALADEIGAEHGIDRTFSTLR